MTAEFFPEAILSFSEFLTLLVCLWGSIELLRIIKIFNNNKDKLAKVLTYEMYSDCLIFILTALMGYFLYISWEPGTEFLVLIRPLVVAVNVLSIRRLRKHFTDIKNGRN